MIKKLLLITLLLLGTTLFALPQNEIKVQMNEKIEKVLNILQDKDSNKDRKTDEIFTLMNSLFDYKVMSRISLGKKWKSFSKEEQNEFIESFEFKLKNSFIEKLDLYTDEKMKILELKHVKKTRIKLLTELVGKDENFSIVYKFYKQKGVDNWLIYDVDILGVSILSSYRKQFASFLKDKSIHELIANLNIKK